MKPEPVIGVLLLDPPPEAGVTADNPCLREIRGTFRSVETFDFPLRGEVVPGATQGKVMAADPELTPRFITAAQKLQRAGVKSISGDCGFMAVYQPAVSGAVTVPVFLSALILVPLVYRMLPPGRRVGILTYDSRSLTEKHFEAAGWSRRDIPVAVVGAENIPSWRTITGKRRSDAAQMGRELVPPVADFVRENPDVGALVLECTLMPPFAPALRRATGLPVFDIIDFTRMMHWAIAGGE